MVNKSILGAISLSLFVGLSANAGWPKLPADLRTEVAELCSKSVSTGDYDGCVRKSRRYLEDLKLRLNICVAKAKSSFGDLRVCRNDASHALVLSVYGHDRPWDEAGMLQSAGLVVRTKRPDRRYMAFSKSVAKFMGGSRLIAFSNGALYIER